MTHIAVVYALSFVFFVCLCRFQFLAYNVFHADIFTFVDSHSACYFFRRCWTDRSVIPVSLRKRFVKFVY